MIEDICYHCVKVEMCVEVGRIMLCNEHKALKQYQPNEKKPTKIKPRSVKRSKQEKEYLTTRKKHLEKHPNCVVCQTEFQKTTPATEIHHKKGRTGALLTDFRHFLSVCRGCHSFIELNPEFAKENNYSTNRI